MSILYRGRNLRRLSIDLIAVALLAVLPVTRSLADFFEGEVGPHHRTWTSDSAIDLSASTLNQVSGRSPNQAVQKVHKVVEISPGMHYWDGERWVPSVPAFSISNNTFIAFQVQHPVRILANLNRRSAVCVRTPDGQLLETTPAGIGLYDAASGRSTVIGKLKNCTGKLVGTNQVWFQDAYDGIDADVVYSIERQSLSQDVVITGHIDPADWGFPSNSTRIQVFTEFYDNHQPDHLIRPLRIERNHNVRTNMAMPDLVDDLLGFGELTFVTGRAFVARSKAYTNGVEAVVVKEFKTLGNRTFMIEQVEYPAIKDGLGALPKRERHASTDTFRKSKTQYASIPSSLSAREQAEAALPTDLTNRIQRLAQVEKLPVQGLVIDYIATLTSMSTPVVFQGDTTYLVPSGWGPLFFNGMVTIEGGAVVKYQIGASLVINNVIVCKTTSHRPAIFTAVDDHSIGEQIGYGTLGQTGYANPAIQQMYPSVSTPLSNLRFCYAQQALSIQGPNTLTQTINHSQFVSCVTGIGLLQTGFGSGSCGALGLEVNNCLMDHVQYPIVGGTICGTATYMVNLFHCTFDTATCFVSGPLYDGWVYGNSVNSIYSQVSYLYSGNAYCYGQHNAFDSSPQFGYGSVSPNVTPIFQTQNFGRHYLAAGINLRNGGTTCGVSTSLLAELQQRTVDPPTLMSGPITMDTTWYRPKKTGTMPNIGYHYDTLDYVLDNTTLSATLRLSGGVAVGLPNAASLSLQSGGRIVSEGTPLVPNRLVSLPNVQEQSPSDGASIPVLMTLSSGSGFADADFRFTEFSVSQGRLGTLIDSGGNPFHRVSFRDCNLRDALVTLYPGSSAATSVGITNNLLHRCQLTLGQTSSSVTAPFNVFLYNNLCLGSPGGASALTLNYAPQYAASVREIHDNLFDQASQSVSLYYPSYVNRSNNGFTSGTSTDLGGDGPTGFTLAYQTGPLGNYYLPSSATQLFDQGSRSADDAGLHHYTTTLAQSIEGTSQVDIGLHYMALAATAPASPTVWVDDSCPPGSSPAGEWIWAQNPAPTSGNLSHLLANYNDMHQDYFMWAAPVYIAPETTLFCDVYVSSSTPPLEVMLQWCAEDATWWYHRAYWGQDQITWAPRTRISSSVPAAGQWVTLNVPASAVDLGGRYISGMAFTLFNGSAAFDRAGFTTGAGGTIITPYAVNDSDGDGMADYLEDRNGNGAHDLAAGESNWQISNLEMTGGNSFQVFTPLK